MSRSIFLPQKPSAGFEFLCKSKTQRHLAKMCEVSTMIARALSGDNTVYRRGSYADYTNAPETMQDYLNAVNRGRQAYDSLPADVRKVYPSIDVFLAALDNPAERERLLSLGVFERLPEEKPIPVSVIAKATESTKDDAHASTLDVIKRG